MTEFFPDESDRASALEGAERSARIAAVQAAARNSRMRPVGSCYYCSAPVGAGHLFCDKDCASDYELVQSARIRNGK